MPDNALTNTLGTTRWHVVGAGAIGSLFASFLQGMRCDISLIGRGEKVADTRIIQRAEVLTEHCFDSSCAADTDFIEHLLVTTKAYDVASAVGALQHRISRATQIVVLANGMGFMDELKQLGLSADYYFGTTTHGAHFNDSGILVHAGAGATTLGQKNALTPNWFNHWQTAIPQCHWDTHIEQALWLKLAINCAINPLTALNQCPNGELHERLELRSQVAALCDEIMEISSSIGFSTVVKGLHQKVTQVIQQTANNRSSMLQDINNRKRTEIDYLSGYMERIARDNGINAIKNRDMLEQVKALE
ncbi:MAG: 2-dehydropantoate 2-reductase [Halieaceae bacterium]|jgi:2-dehydropantoate 2-reductase